MFTFQQALFIDRMQSFPIYIKSTSIRRICNLGKMHQKAIRVVWLIMNNNRKTSDTRGTLVGNGIGDHSDVVGASPVGAAPTTSSLST